MTPIMICVCCELEKYPLHKLHNHDFVTERINEFYPQDEFVDWVFVCEKCNSEMEKYYLIK